MTFKIAGLGWLPDPPDHRDRRTHHTYVQSQLRQVLPALSKGTTATGGAMTSVGSLVVDLRPWCSPIENQGQLGSCTAHAVVGALEYFELKTRRQHLDASRLFLYRATRRFLGWEGRGDTGAFIRSTIKALRLFGTCPEAYWPYERADWDAEPDAFHYSFAANFKAIEYYRLPLEIELLKSALSNGNPFAFGFTCFESLMAPSTKASGVIPYPSREEKAVGGHAVLAVGYTESHVLIRNSWGTEWGVEGCGFLPWQYFDASHPLADDCWSLLKADWVDIDEGLATPARAIEPSPKRPEPKARTATIRVVEGRDPVRRLPMCYSATGMVPLGEANPALPTTNAPLAVYLRDLRLNKSFDFSLFGDAVNELYVVTIAWDLSGKPPVIFPPKSVSDDRMPPHLTYDAKAGTSVSFVGDGIQVWPSQPVTGGLYVRIVVIESDSDVRAAGQRLANARSAIEKSELVSALAMLAAAPTAGSIAGIGAAADALLGTVATILQSKDDDLVAVFDGTFGADSGLTTGQKHYEQLGATVDLFVHVGTEVASPPPALQLDAAPSPRKRSATAPPSGDPHGGTRLTLGDLLARSAAAPLGPAKLFATPATPSAAPELSGPEWVDRFPGSDDVSALALPFRTSVERFLAALAEAGIAISISQTLRPPERAYLMHWAWQIGRKGFNPAQVPPMAGVNIQWIHPQQSASRAAAEAMVKAFELVFEPALKSRHTEGLALDMNVRWTGKKIVKDASGAPVTLDSSNGHESNPILHQAGATYHVVKLVSDPPHWSLDGH